MEADGHIIIRETRNSRGQLVQRTYEWRGGPIARVSWTALATINGGSLRFPKVGERFRLGPLWLVCQEDDFIHDAIKVEIDGPIAQVRFGLRFVARHAEVAYRRLILTAEVWGLAECDRAVVPSLRDLRITKYLSRARSSQRRSRQK